MDSVNPQDFLKARSDRKRLRGALRTILLEVDGGTISQVPERRLELIGEIATVVLKETDEPGEGI